MHISGVEYENIEEKINDYSVQLKSSIEELNQFFAKE